MAVSIDLSITQNSQNVAENTSNVTVRVTAKWDWGSLNLDKRSGWLKIGETKYTFSSEFNSGQSQSGSSVLFSKTIDIDHNSDGSKVLYCSASYSSGVSSGTVTDSTYKTLTTIPRASVPTIRTAETGGSAVTSCKMGEKIYILTNRKSTAFTHKLTYSFGGKSGLTSGIGYPEPDVSTNFTPPASLASSIPNATYGTLIFTLKTYKGSTLVGTKTVSMKLYIADNMKPSVKVTTADPTGYLTKYGAYVAGKSTIKATLTETLSYGSAIKSRKITMNGGTYTQNPATSGVISSTENTKITATVTDNRGKTSSQASATIAILPYAAPQIKKFSVSRCNADGTANDEGNSAKVSYELAVSPLNNKNSKTFKIKYKKLSAASYSEKTVSVGYTANSSLVITGIDTLNSYEFVGELTDDFGSSSASKTLSTAESVMDFHSSGSGMSVGKISENKAEFDVGYAARFRKKVRFEQSIGLEDGGTGSISGLADAAGGSYVRKAKDGAYLVPVDPATVRSEIGAQANLGFTPIQQGGGAGQKSNKIYIGWTDSKLNAQVDVTNFGALAFESWVNSQLSGKANSGHKHSALFNGSGETYMTTGGHICPVKTTQQIGMNANRWAYIITSHPVDVSSDMRLKANFDRDMDLYIEMLDHIDPLSYTIIADEDGVKHVGYIAQEVWRAMKSVGLEIEDFGGFVRYMQEEGSVYSYSLRYDEFIPILHAKINKLETKIEELERQQNEEIALLKERIAAIERM